MPDRIKNIYLTSFKTCYKIQLTIGADGMIELEENKKELIELKNKIKDIGESL